jgi:hypothetical protein
MIFCSPNLEKLINQLIEEYNKGHPSVKKTEFKNLDDSTIYEGQKKGIIADLDDEISLSESMIHSLQK